MKKKLFAGCIVLLLLALFTLSHRTPAEEKNAWIRVNLLGYKPASIKVAVYGAKDNFSVETFRIVDALSGKIVHTATAGRSFGAYGPFTNTYRLDFSRFNTPGRYVLHAGAAISPEFTIAEDVYKGAADFCLRYMRQQRTGFNPFLKDSCHTQDGYTLYGPMKDSTHIDVVGGWHDASDYLQYSTTSANATYHLLAAYRDFPKVFSDQKLANGLDGRNGMADVLDEARWGLDWLLKMHPRPDWMFNQIADDRDHMGMRIPKEDTFYGKGIERPVYFVSGKPQQRGKFMNNTTGTTSTAAKFASAFSLAYSIFSSDKAYADILHSRAYSAYNFSLRKLGVAQTASVRSPYIYEEDNWIDDIELALASIGSTFKLIANQNQSLIASSYDYAKQEPVTPWLGKDTAKHYQWYPFINLGHYELAKYLKGKQRDTIIGFYKQGIELVWQKAKQNAFYRGVPFIWCSNNLTTSFAIQCYWYRSLTNDDTYAELEQANFDWLMGCNPWGTSMVYGLPSWGDTPVDPHSAFTHIKKYPIDGGLVDGPVYGSIYNKLIGIKLYEPDEYAQFQSDLVVYHDDYGDYSTNEPTMDGTASLIYLFAAKEAEKPNPFKKKGLTYYKGAIIRGDTTRKNLALVFTGDEYGEGGQSILKTLKEQNTKASFFLTGRFYRNPSFRKTITELNKAGHYLGAHSDQHLLYCDWNNRDSLLVSSNEFGIDLARNFKAMSAAGVSFAGDYFLPPYEWYNDSIAVWSNKIGLDLINYTPGTICHADYTTPDLKNYRSSDEIMRSILHYEQSKSSGLNGFILLMHIGAGDKRTDKFYKRLPELIKYLKSKDYQLVRINELLNEE